MTLVLPATERRRKSLIPELHVYVLRPKLKELDNCYRPLRVNTFLIMSVGVLLNQSSVTLDLARERTGYVLMIVLYFPKRGA